jgi:capsular exopolysaccharide synthesis family protein
MKIEEFVTVPSMPYENQLVQPAPSEDQGANLDLLGFIRRRKSFVILFGLLGVAVGYMMFQRETPQFRSESWVQVIHRTSDPRLTSMLAEKDLTDSDYVIKSKRTLGAAFQKHELSELSLLRGLAEEDAVNRMAGMIATKNLSANVVQVSATGTDPDDLRSIVQAASEEYVFAQQGNYKDASEELKEILGRARDEFLTMLKKAEDDYSKFREHSRLNTNGDNPFRARAMAAQEKVSSLELEKTELKAQLAQLEEAVNRGGSREAVMLLVGKYTENSATGTTLPESPSQGIASALFQLIKEEALLSAQLGSDHPKLKTIRMQIEMTRNHLKDLAGEKATAEGSDVEPATDFLAVYLQSLHEELLIIERQQSDLKILAANEEAQARTLMQEEIEDTNRKNEMGRLSKLFNETTLQISEIQVKAGMGGITASILSPAQPGYLIYPVRTSFLGMGGFLGAMVGLVLGYLVEVADRSFRKPEDIIREFGVPIVGHVPFITEQRLKSVPAGSVMDRTAVSVHLPRSRPAEAYRAVRTAICFSVFGGAHRVISVTSPAAGDGKSTLALNLALSLAQSGKRTVLVESDFRRPKVHKLTGVDNKSGFVDVLRGDVELTDAIKETKVPDFFVLPCGKRPKDPAELLARPQFEQLLQVLREKFEYVIIDTPPVLAVTDPCGVAARVDGVLVCMRLSRHTRDLGRRTIEQLRDIGATISGIVINGVEERDAYGYGNYRYSDYRYYYKNYNYKYGEYGSKDGREYYADDHAGDLAGSASDNLNDSSVS